MSSSEQGESIREVTVLFADISGSTRLYAEQGNRAAFELTSRCIDLFENEVKKASGRVVKRLGDGILAVFERPEEGIESALAMEREVSDPTGPLWQHEVRVRCGLSHGAAVMQGDDVHGDVVNVAAGLLDLASAEEIFISGEVFDHLPGFMQDSARQIDRLTIPKRPEEVRVYQYLTQREDQTVQLSAPRREALFRLVLSCQDKSFVLGPERPKIRIGRSEDNDLCLDLPVVSRSHAEVAFRGDRFVLTDFSTNGTYVQVDDGPLLRVVRGERTLTGSGGIALGAAETTPLVRYRVTSD